MNTEQLLRVFRLLFVAIYWEHQYICYKTYNIRKQLCQIVNGKMHCQFNITIVISMYHMLRFKIVLQLNRIFVKIVCIQTS